jgi:hypothetical protein
VSGYLVARYGQGGATGAWTAGDKVEVFPGQSGQVNDSPSAENNNPTGPDLFIIMMNSCSKWG